MIELALILFGAVVGNVVTDWQRDRVFRRPSKLGLRGSRVITRVG